MGALSPLAKQQFFDSNGAILAGGKLYTYVSGASTTPLATYTDAALSVANANPVILDARGECTLYLQDAQYRFVLKDSNDVTIWTRDNIVSDLFAGALGGTSPIIRVNIAALEALTGMSNDALATTLGYYTDNDGGHGTYRYDSSSTATVNGGTVFNAAGGVGRWLLLHHGVIDLRQGGCKLDGVTDDGALANSIIALGIPVTAADGSLLTSIPIEIVDDLKFFAHNLSIDYTGTGYAVENPDKLTAAVSKVDMRGFIINSPAGGGLDIEGVFESKFSIDEINGNTSVATAGKYGFHAGWSAGATGQAGFWNDVYIGRIRGFGKGVQLDPNANALRLCVGRFRSPCGTHDLYIAPPNGSQVVSGCDITILDISNTGAPVSVFCDGRNIRLWMRHEANSTVGLQLGANHRQVDITWNTTAASVTQVLDNLYVDGVIRRGTSGSATYEEYRGYDVVKQSKDSESNNIVDYFVGNSTPNANYWTGSGSGTSAITDSTSGTGAVLISTGAVLNQDRLLAFGIAPVRSFTRSSARFIARVRPNMLTQQNLQFGFKRDSDACPLDNTKSGVWFENMPGASGTNWICAQADGATKNTADSNVAAAVETDVYIIDVDNNGRGKFYINGTLVGDLTASGGNSTNRMSPFFYIKTTDANNKTMEVELFKARIDISTFT